MTRAQVEKIVTVWQGRLKLSQWSVKVDFDKPANASNDAQVSIDNHYDNATVLLSSAWADWTREYTNLTLVHELLHLHERDVEEAIRSVEGLVGRPAYTLYWDRYKHEREGLVDRLAAVLVENLGVV